MLRFAIPITKVQKLEDGRLLVAGRMTDETLDSQGEIMDYEGSKEAITHWRGNVREAHDAKKPVGKSLALVPNDKDRAIDVEVFVSAGAPDTQAKVLDGTLASFSVGGPPPDEVKVEKVNGKDIRRVTKWKMNELSLVDVGANPNANIVLVKADGVATEALLDVPPSVAKPPKKTPAERLMDGLAKQDDDKPKDEPKGDEDVEKLCKECGKTHKTGPCPPEAKADEAAKTDAPASEKTEKTDATKSKAKPRKTSKAMAAFLEKHWGDGEESDLRAALDVLDGLKGLLMSEQAEGEVGEEGLIVECIGILKRFIQQEAGELVEGDGDEGLLAMMGPTMLALANSRAGAITKADVLAVIEKAEKEREAQNERIDDLAEAIGHGLRKVQDAAAQGIETAVSKALGEVKAAIGDFKAMRETMEKIAKQPAMPPPPVRFEGQAPGGPASVPGQGNNERSAVLLKWAQGADPLTRAYMERAAALERK